uniref:Uncharacterized protein n=1 Tax=Romanomermis culicivorax TaxID=13658 RepID=A0A915KTK3_ROMCU
MAIQQFTEEFKCPSKVCKTGSELVSEPLLGGQSFPSLEQAAETLGENEQRWQLLSADDNCDDFFCDGLSGPQVKRRLSNRRLLLFIRDDEMWESFVVVTSVIEER